MDSLLLSHPRCRTVPSFRCIKQAASVSSKPYLPSQSLLNLAEVAVRPLIFGWKKHSRAQFVTSCINPINGSKGGRSSPRKISASGRTAKGAKIKQQQESSKGKRDDAADQEEIISLFRRIQSSIAKGESEDPKKKRSSSSRGDKPAAESVLEIIRSSRKQTRDKGSLKGGSKLIPRQRGLPRREKGVEVEDIQSIENFRLTRPPSNFVKRSPIPFPSAPRGKDRLLISEVSPAVSETIASQLEKLEEMKLPELKELAKSRGVKGYSKLKKKELVELLRS
ncbi:hypothetical protein CRG98_023122 [Punica granatum]|nr:hypothetical protein CRG98_023122 [Punica granatum]